MTLLHCAHLISQVLERFLYSISTCRHPPPPPQLGQVSRDMFSLLNNVSHGAEAT